MMAEQKLVLKDTGNVLVQRGFQGNNARDESLTASRFRDAPGDITGNGEDTQCFHSIDMLELQ